MTVSRTMQNNADDASTARTGVAYGLAAFLWWGMVPVYFKAVSHVPPGEVLAHRIIWSVVLLVLMMRFQGRHGAGPAALRDRSTLITLLVTTLLIALNWFVFIWAVDNGQLLEASLGYFINPLVNVLLGVVFLRERLRKWQTISVLLAALAVGYLTVTHGRLPLVALVLAGSFGFYGLLRKTAKVDALVGLTVETTLLFPLALAYLGLQAWRHECVFATVSRGTDLLLMAGGIVTAVPLLWFANAARRLRLSTIGFMQYIAPTGQFLLAVMAFGESFTRAHLISFVVIWSALVIYSVDTAAQAPAKRRPSAESPEPADAR